jgi:hypothetical protein
MLQADIVTLVIVALFFPARAETGHYNPHVLMVFVAVPGTLEMVWQRANGNILHLCSQTFDA